MIVKELMYICVHVDLVGVNACSPMKLDRDKEVHCSSMQQSHSSLSKCEVSRQLDSTCTVIQHAEDSYPSLNKRQMNGCMGSDTLQTNRELLNNSFTKQSFSTSTATDHEVIDLTFSQAPDRSTTRGQVVSSAKVLDSLVSDDDSEADFDQNFVASTPYVHKLKKKRHNLKNKVLSSASEEDNMDNEAEMAQFVKTGETDGCDHLQSANVPVSDDEDLAVTRKEVEEYLDFPPPSPPFFMNDWEDEAPESPELFCSTSPLHCHSDSTTNNSRPVTGFLKDCQNNHMTTRESSTPATQSSVVMNVVKDVPTTTKMPVGS